MPTRAEELRRWLELAKGRAQRGIYSATLIACGVAAAAVAHAQEEDAGLPAPQVVLNSPFASTLWRADIDSGERFVVSASHARTVAVWPTEELSSYTLRRFPPRQEESRRSHPPAISPDARLIAYGVPPLADDRGAPVPGTGLIYIFERDSDPSVTTPVRTLEVPMRTLEIRFSPDNTHLAATFAGGCGLRVWSTETWEPVAVKSSEDGIGCCDMGEPDPSRCQGLPVTYSLSFNPAPDGVLWLATSGDVGVRTYDRSESGAIIEAGFVPSDRLGLLRPAGIAFSPDGHLLAVGDRDSSSLIVLDAASLRGLQTFLPHKDFREPLRETVSLNQVAWLGSADGGLDLFAGGYLPCRYLKGVEAKSRLEVCILRWRWGDDAHKAPAGIFPFGVDTVMTLRGLPKSSRLLVASARAIALLDADGNPGEPLRDVVESNAVDFRGVSKDGADSDIDGRAFRVSEDGKAVYFEDYARTDSKGKTLAFRLDVDKSHVETGTPSFDGLTERDQDRGVVDSWRNVRLLRGSGTFPRVLGNEITGFIDDPLDRSRAVDVHRQNGAAKYVLWGTSNYLRLVDSSANVVCKLGIASEANRVKLVDGGSLAVVGHGDGVLRWYRVGTPGPSCGFELLLSALIDQKSPGIWQVLAWMPDGTFAGPNFDGAGWIDARPSDPTRFIPLASFKHLYSTEAIASVLDEPPVVQKVSGSFDVENAILRPRLEVTSTHNPIPISTHRQKLELVATNHPVFGTDPSSGPLSEPLLVQLRANSHAVAKTVGDRSYAADEAILIKNAGPFEITFDIPSAAVPSEVSGDVFLNLSYWTEGQDESAMPKIRRLWTGPPMPKQRRLLAIIIGLSNYRIDGLTSSLKDLSFAHKDAIDFATLLVTDFDDRSSQNVPLDFAEIHLSLFLAMPENTDRSLLARLENRDKVAIVTSAIKPEAIRSKIFQYVEMSADKSQHDDLLLIYFAGHGMIKKSAHQSSLPTHYLLLPGFDINAPMEKQLEHSLTQGGLIEFLRDSPQEKIIALDACQSSFEPARLGNVDVLPLDLHSLFLQIKGLVRNTHLFLSATTGIPSIEQNVLSFEDTYQRHTSRSLFPTAEDPSRKGNGLFTLALLSALVNPQTDRSQPRDKRIGITEIETAIAEFYNAENTKEITAIRAAMHGAVLPTPRYDPLEVVNRHSYLRTLP